MTFDFDGRRRPGSRYSRVKTARFLSAVYPNRVDLIDGGDDVRNLIQKVNPQGRSRVKEN